MTSRAIAADYRTHLYTGFPKNMEQLRKNVWLSDPGAYPIIAVLSFTVGFAGYFMTYNVFRNPDVRISASRRQELIRTWEH